MNTDPHPAGTWSESLEERDGWHVTRYDPDTRSASEAIAYVLATVADVEPDALRPLHETVDPDALEALFAPTLDGRPRAGGEVRFTHDGYDVSLRADGEIGVRSAIDAAGSSATESAAESD